jgi:hypothetical protein
LETHVTDFGNGPLPEHLESSTYFTAGRREWALPKAAALEYLDWCEAQGLGVHGFDIWYPTKPSPTVTDEGLGNVEGVAAARESIRRHPGEYASGQVVWSCPVGC